MYITVVIHNEQVFVWSSNSN